MKNVEHDISKLPRWAQNRIEVAEKNTEYWKGLYSEATGENARIRVRDDRVVFDPTPSRYGNIGIGRLTVVLQEDGSLEVLGSQKLAVMPRASNVIEVRAEER